MALSGRHGDRNRKLRDLNCKHETENKPVGLYSECLTSRDILPARPRHLTLPNSTTNWELSVLMPEPRGDTSHSNHHSTNGIFTRNKTLKVIWNYGKSEYLNS